MPGARGTKPKEEGSKINRSPTLEWTEVPDVPFQGAPELTGVGRVTAATRAWWAAVTTMPHCVLWRAPDWQRAFDTARIHAAVVKGDLARAAELRLREREMGTTADARRDLRIRYMPVKSVDADAEGDEGETVVTSFEERRRERLLNAD